MLQTVFPSVSPSVSTKSELSRPEQGDGFAAIATVGARLRLVCSGSAVGWPSEYLYQPCDAASAAENEADHEGWLWEGTAPSGDTLGFLGLVPAGLASARQGIFGPVLAVMLKRELAGQIAADMIAGLMAWLGRNHICHVVHASHAPDDLQLAAWLDAAGFLYTGCQGDDGTRSMILML